MTDPLRTIKCKRTRELLTRARAQGFRVETTRTSHLRIYAPDGSWVSGGSCTTGDERSHLPMRAALRRAGYVGC